jgi:hypothetical protein
MPEMPAPNFSLIRDAIVECVAKRREIQAVYIFGSVVSGRTRRDSDIDVALLLNEKSPCLKMLDYRLRVAADISKAIGRSDLDLVILNGAPPVLAHQVLSKGKLVFERSRSARVAFHVRAVNRYLDTEPMRALFRQYLKQRIREGKIFG